MSNKRSFAADIIRILAFFLVVFVHSFAYNGFAFKEVVGKRMFLMVLLRTFALICVPLFMILSGYLLRRKQLTKSYYQRVSKIIITYVLASLFCVIYTVVFLKQDFSVKSTIANIFSFSAAPYSWYIEMYLGLFLLIPFLNTIYNSLTSQKYKIWLIITFIILTALPSVLNVYNFTSFDWWKLPSSSTDVNKIIPSFWQSMYPVTYYFIGCYLSEYGLKINRGLNILLIILSTIFTGSFCYWRSYKTTFIAGLWCDYYSLFIVVLSLLVFTLIINTNYNKLPNWLGKIIQKVSSLCLGGYLVSYVFDNELYSALFKKIPLAAEKFEYSFVLVPLIFILSLFASYLLSIIQFLIENGFSLLCAAVRGTIKKSKQLDL